MKLVGWAQSVVTFHGGASAHLDGVAFIFRMHLVLGMTLFLLFPFSRLAYLERAGRVSDPQIPDCSCTSLIFSRCS